MSESQIREQRVRVAAYFLWEDAGRPDGMATEIWLTAEIEEVDKTRAEAITSAILANATDP